MANEEASPMSSKMWWNEKSTSVLLSEYKKYYNQWQDGKINKKKNMWKKVTEGLIEKGHPCSAEQVENRFKTLQRSYRKSFKTLGNNESSSEFSEIFVQSLMFDDSLIEDISKTPCSPPERSTAVFEEVDENQRTESVSTSVPSKRPMASRFKISLPKKKPLKTSVDVLLEIKELIKKVEIRRQVRHSQTMKIANERNEIMRRKNQLLEQLLSHTRDRPIV